MVNFINKLNVQGECAEGFEAVYDAFVHNFESGLELGASLCAYIEGKCVVDLWGGYQDRDFEKPWQKDTIVCMASTGKSIGCLCIHMLHDRGLIDLNAPVAKYWPQFAKNGKEKVKVKHVLSHLGGMPFPDEVQSDSAYDIDAVLSGLEKQSLLWPAGEHPFYHSFVIGYLVEGLVRAVANCSVTDFWRAEIAGPLGVDVYAALRGNEHERCSQLHFDEGDVFFDSLSDIKTDLGRMWRPMPSGDYFNTRAFREWGIPNIAHGNARGLAKIYALLSAGGKLADVRLLSKKSVENATREQFHIEDGFMQVPLRFGLGFTLSNETFPLTGGTKSFAGMGYGGAVGMADPDISLGFAYAPNRASQELNSTSSKRLLDAVLAAVAKMPTSVA